MAAMEKGRDALLQRRRIGHRKPASAALRARPQTPEEERQFKAAFRLFLIEMARQMLDRQKESI